MSTGSVTVRIENTYSDGHTSTATVDVEPPDDTTVNADLDDWWSETVFEHTGDGHSADSELGSCYTATVIGVQHQHGNNLAWLMGESFEWID